MWMRWAPASYYITRGALFVDRFSGKRHHEASIGVRCRIRASMEHDFVLGGEGILPKLVVTI